MTDFIKLQWDTTQADKVFAELLRRGQDLGPLMADIGETLIESTQRRFAAGVDPDGVPWVPLADGSGRTPLTLTGSMRDEIAANSGSDYVDVFATRKQAKWHQFGTDPYVILPKNKKALAFGGKVVAKVNHPGLPARPFMGVSTEDAKVIEDLAAGYLQL